MTYNQALLDGQFWCKKCVYTPSLLFDVTSEPQHSKRWKKLHCAHEASKVGWTGGRYRLSTLQLDPPHYCHASVSLFFLPSYLQVKAGTVFVCSSETKTEQMKTVHDNSLSFYDLRTGQPKSPPDSWKSTRRLGLVSSGEKYVVATSCTGFQGGISDLALLVWCHPGLLTQPKGVDTGTDNTLKKSYMGSIITNEVLFPTALEVCGDVAVTVSNGAGLDFAPYEPYSWQIIVWSLKDMRILGSEVIQGRASTWIDNLEIISNYVVVSGDEIRIFQLDPESKSYLRPRTTLCFSTPVRKYNPMLCYRNYGKNQLFWGYPDPCLRLFDLDKMHEVSRVGLPELDRAVFLSLDSANNRMVFKNVTHFLIISFDMENHTSKIEFAIRILAQPVYIALSAFLHCNNFFYLSTRNRNILPQLYIYDISKDIDQPCIIQPIEEWDPSQRIFFDGCNLLLLGADMIFTMLLIL